jgi:hypothetical protein
LKRCLSLLPPETVPVPVAPIKWMTEPGAPFFKQLQQLEVGPIDAVHLAAWIERRAKTGGLPSFPYGRDIVRFAGPCTGDIIRLAKTVFDLAKAGNAKAEIVSTAFDAIALVELNGEFTARWHECALSQRAVLRALAAGLQPTAAATLRTYGVKSASTAATALEALFERYLLSREATGVLIDSPFFSRWVAFNAA